MKRISTLVIATIFSYLCYSQPSTQASGIAFTPVSNQTGQMIITWTKGNGDHSIVMISQSTTIGFVPVNGTSYTSNPAFGTGTNYAVGGGTTACVFNSTSPTQTVTVSGLSAGNSYFVYVYEYLAAGSLYNVNSASSNPLTLEYYSSGTSWNTPTRVSTATIQAWGGGASGGGVNGANINGGGGGGGGAYTISSGVAVSGTIPIVVAAAKTGTNGDGADGDNTTFGTTTVVAVGGKKGINALGTRAGGAGGLGSACTPSGPANDGGGGGSGNSNGQGGGGGGSSAGVTVNGGGGGNGGNSTAGTAGVAPTGAGAGGIGGLSASGTPGFFPGGGGGGCGDGTPHNGGNSAGGLVILSYAKSAPTITAAVISSPTGTITTHIGSSITIRVTAGNSETGLVLGSGSTINSKATSSFLDNNNGTYDITYIVAANDNDQAQGSIPFSIKLADGQGNTSSAVTSYTSVNNVGVDAHPPTISNVTIPNSPMKVNDVVTATVTVGDDAGQTYSLVSGTIDGFTLGSLNRTNSTTYTATFTITNGGADVAAAANIPISNLVLADPAGNNSAAYSSPIIQGSDPIDANNPIISSVTVPNSSMKINDVVTATITVVNDLGQTYTLVSGAIDGFTLGSFSRVSATSYTATFTVASGGTDVAAASNIPVSNLVIADPATNQSSVYSSPIIQGGDPIDANAPTITNVTIPNVSMHVGSVVTATITVGDDGGQTYLFSSGNIDGFTLGSFTRSNSTTYTATFTVTNGGTNVAAGVDIAVSLIIHDPAGNPSATYNTAISQGSDPIDANGPSITNVTVPNAPMKVNDVVTATITVGDDGGNAYTLSSGTIDGFTLGSLNRVSSTSYTATFTVTNGGTDVAAASNIIVSLVLLNVNLSPSVTYSSPIIQGSDPIDANNPIISSVTVPNSSMKINDVVTATITVVNDLGQTYTLVSGAIDGFTLGSFSRVSATSYTATFTVASGGTDVAAASNIPVSNLVIADPATNQSSVYSSPIIQGGDPIDANAPTITNVTIPNVSMHVGSVVTATITVGDDGGQTYLFSSGNIDGFTLGSFTRSNSTTYTATFTVTNGGTDVPAASDIPVSLIIHDPAGNPSANYNTAISQGSDPIFANGPVISNVSIPNVAMKVNDVVTATITVGDDGGNAYSLSSGTIDGFTLGSLSRVSSTSYTATFTVTNGGTDVAAASNIIVSLVLIDVNLSPSVTYNTPISQGSDPIDANNPIISTVTIPNVTMKVGSVVTATITVVNDLGQTYSLVSGAIDGFTLGSFSRTNATTYTATFTIIDGGTDVPAASNIPVSSLVIADPAGNQSATYSSPIIQAGDLIDANVPTISNVTIPNVAMKVGSIVTATVTVGDDGGQTYTLSSGNIDGFALGSYTRTNSTTYTATFTVTNGGTDVAAASDIPVSLIILDPATNPSANYTTAISQANDPIDANKPIISNVTIPNIAMKVNDVVTATITVADDGGQTYSLISGTIDGFTLGVFTRITNTTYTATFTITNGGADVAAASNIPVSNLIIADPATNQSLTYSTPIIQTNDPIDANIPTISNVTIPNAAMKVGSVVTATITVGNDGGQTYTLTSGAIDAFPLGSFTRINATTYTATFTVTNGGTDIAAASNIPVSNLVISDPATNPSAIYSTPIVQGSDPIDANLPTITNVTVPNVPMIVGNLVTATITVGNDGGLTYTLSSGNVDGFALGSFTRINATTYTATFTVTNGGTDIAAISNIPVSLIILDPATNPSVTYNTPIIQINDPIDANNPTQLTVSTVTANAGGNVVPGFYNATNTTGVSITVPLTNSDASLDNGSIQLQIRNIALGFISLDAPQTITNADRVAGFKTISVTNATFTSSLRYADGNVLSFNAIVSDFLGNQTTWNTSVTTLTVDLTPPLASTIAISSALKGIGGTNGIVSTSVNFLVTFTELNLPLSGIDLTDFTVNNDATVSYTPPLVITGAGLTRTVTINGITGTGRISLGLTDDNSILDAAGNPLDGVANGSIAPSYTGSQYYSMVLLQPTNPVASITAPTTTTTSITVKWDAPAVGSQAATHFLVMAKPTTSGAYPSGVADATYVNNGAMIQNLVNTGLAGQTAVFGALSSGVSYDFIIYPYTLGTNDSQDNIDFNTSSPPTVTAVTNISSASTITLNTAGTTILSTVNASPGQDAMVFTIQDDGVGDNAPFKFTSIQFNSNPPNNITKWTEVIGGALLYVGAGPTLVPATVNINDTNITFTGIAGTNPGDPGYIANAGSSQYRLKIWLKTNLAGTQNYPLTIDGLQFNFTVDGSLIVYNDATPNPPLQKSSRSTTVINSGANPVNVIASLLTFTTQPPVTIGVGTNFPVPPVIHALDINGNLDLNYSNAFTSSTTVTTSSPLTNFVSGVLTLSNYKFTAPGSTTITISGSAGGIYPAFTVGAGTAAVSSSVTAVISNLTQITAGAGAEPPSFSSLTTAETGAILPQLSAVQNFDFTITDDVGVTAITDDALPTLINQIVISQSGNNNVPVLGDWTKVIAGAELSNNVNGNIITGVVSSSALTFSAIPTTLTTDLGYIADNGAKTYQLKIWLKNPVDSTVADNIDDKDFGFNIVDTDISVGSSPTSSTLQSSNTNSGASTNQIIVTAAKLHFTTQPTSPQSYDAAISPTLVVKARDVNNNTDIDYDYGANPVSISATQIPTPTAETFPVVSATPPISTSNGIYTFNAGMNVASSGGGLNNDVVNLSASSGSLTSGISTHFTLKYSGNSDIIKDPTFVHAGSAGNSYTPNILYKNYPNGVFAANTDGVALERFMVRDGGAAHNDTDGSPTVLQNITLNISNYQYLNAVALYNGSTLIAQLPVAGNITNVVGITGDLPFTTLNPFQANSHSDGFLTVYATFIGTGMVDNQVIQVKVTNVTAGGVSSSFNAGGTSTNFATLTSPDNQTEVVATQIVYTTIPLNTKIFVPLAVSVQAQDANGNLDADYNGTISAFTTSPGPTGFTTAHNPSGSFVGGLLSFPFGATPDLTNSFNFTDATFGASTDFGNTQLVLNSGAANTTAQPVPSIDAGAIAGTSAIISVTTSFESWLTRDPTFTIPATIPYVSHQEAVLTNSSYELLRVLLVDGSRTSPATYGGQPLNVNNTDSGDGDPNGDLDGASTNLSSVTIQISNPWDLRTIALFDGNGNQMGSQINVTAAYNSGPANFTFTAGTLLTAPDDSYASFSVRVSFKNTYPEIQDGDNIKIQLISASVSTGSEFFNGSPANSASAGTYIGGGLASNQNPNTLGLIDVVATSFDFTTQASPFAGVNWPIGPSYASAPFPTNSAAIVRAQDKFALLDLDFTHPAAVTGAVASASTNASFVNGVLNLDGMTYTSAGVGTLTVAASGLSAPYPSGINSSNPVINTTGTITSNTGSTAVTGSGTQFTTDLAVGSIINNASGVQIGTVASIINNTSLTLAANANLAVTGATYNTNSIPATLVDVLNVDVTQATNGVLVGSGNPAVYSIKGGTTSAVLFGVTFTPQHNTTTEPGLKQFSFTFDNPYQVTAGGVTTYTLKNFRIFESPFGSYSGSTDVTTPAIGGSLAFTSSASNLNLDIVTVTFSSARPLAVGGAVQALSYFMVADVDATANIATKALTPQLIDAGYLSSTAPNIIVTNGTAYINGGTTTTITGNKYSFASTKPPVLLTTKGSGTSPYNGQLNVDPGLTEIDLEFDTQVLSVDGGLNGGTELFDRTTNTKIADLVAQNAGSYLANGSDYRSGVANVINPLKYNISFVNGHTLKPDSVYYVTVKQGSFNPISNTGTGIADQGQNFFGGISYNGTLYFKIASPNAPTLSNASGSFINTTSFANTSITNISTTFNLTGTAYYLVLPTGSQAPDTIMMKSSVAYHAAHPAVTIVASGNYLITQINAVQTVSFPAALAASTTYDVWLYAQSDALPHPIRASGPYGGSASNFAAGSAGPTLKISTQASPPTYSQPVYSLCPDSYVTLTNPIVISESSPGDFSAGYVQDFNILLPTGFQFDGTTFPSIQLVGADFTAPATPTLSFKNNTLLNVSYTNSGSSSIDYIVITNLKIIGASGSSAGSMQRFFGKNSFTSSTAPLASLTLFPTNPLTFNNSYSQENTFPSPSPAIVTAIPDNYVDQDPSISGSIRLVPIITQANDFNASFFSGNGVTNDLLSLNAVALNSAFNITMSHTDQNGCASQTSVQYEVYNHNSPISIKLGTAQPGSYPAGVSPQLPVAGTQQALVNAQFPNTSTQILPSQPLAYNDLAGYYLKKLVSDLPASELLLNAKGKSSQIISGTSWRSQVNQIVLKPDSTLTTLGIYYYSYQWDYSVVLNAFKTDPTIGKDPYNNFVNTTLNKNTYWKGGSLGKVEFTGVYQSTADLSVIAPFRQDVELFVPPVPLIEIGSSNINPSTDGADGTKNAIDSKTPAQHVSSYLYTNPSGYTGTPVFCQAGGIITLNGYPAALAGISSGSFAAYDYSSYNFANPSASTQLPNPVSAFVDNGNGTATLDPSKMQNFYNDILVVYTYQDDNSPAVGTGYLVMRVTPNPVAQFTMVSVTGVGSPSSAFEAFCLGNPINFDATPSSIVQPTQSGIGASTNTIFNYTWNFGDPNSGANQNAPIDPANLPKQLGGGAGQVISAAYLQALPASQSQTFDKPQHYFNLSQQYTITLQLTSNWSCPSSTAAPTVSPTIQTANALVPGWSGQITVGEIPIVDFGFLRNCVGDQILFTDKSSTSGGTNAGAVAKFDWQFGDGVPGTPDFTGYNTAITPSAPFNFPISPDGRNLPAMVNGVNAVGTNVSHTYTTPGSYTVTLTTTTSLGCFASAPKGISQLPVASLDPSGAFQEYFDSSNGGWIFLDLSGSTPTTPGNTSWKYNSGIGKWTAGSPYITSGEKSALYSACLNLTAIPRPAVQFNNRIDLNPSDGLVLQYSSDSLNIQDPNKTWNVLGTPTTTSGGITPSPGLDWYNVAALASAPGTGYANSNNSSAYGWSHFIATGKKDGIDSAGFIAPKHSLDNLITKKHVVLRFALTTLPIQSSTTAPPTGITLDSVRVGSRTRTVLLENFTTTDATSVTLNNAVLQNSDSITAFVNRKSGSTQIVNINYHIGFMGRDPFNFDNPADPSARALYYNVNQVPYAFLDGVNSTNSPTFSTWGTSAYDLETLRLAQANFLDASNQLTTVTTNNPDGSIQVNVNVTPGVDLPVGIGGTALFAAVLEKQIALADLKSPSEVKTGENQFSYVLRKMLPNAAGTVIPITTPLTAKTPVSLGQLKWIPDTLYTNTLTVVVFLQNVTTKEVYQAEIFDNLTAPPTVTEVSQMNADNVKVYPNPSDKEFTVVLPNPATQTTSIQIADQLGRIIDVGAFNEGEQTKTVNTQGLSAGMYILMLGNNGSAVRTKIIVVHK